MNQLPIRRLTLYKQGIGYYERQGRINNQIVTLVVPLDGINDVLKSLNVTVQGSGQLLGVDYETPEDKQKRLDGLSVKLSDRSSLIDLLSSLRGRLVTIESAEGTVSGRLIGVETSLSSDLQSPLVLLQDAENAHQIRTLPISNLRNILLQEDQAVTDVAYFLDVIQTEQNRTTLTIRLSEEESELNVNYLAPSPTWRVSYRLVSDGNKVNLRGWGIFENYLEEDLDQVQLTLVSGRPISFNYELYESYVPSRPIISEDPNNNQNMTMDPRLFDSLSTITHELRSPLGSMTGYASLLKMDTTLSEKQQSYLRSIERGAEQMSQNLNKLLDMARLQEDSDNDSWGHFKNFAIEAGPLGDLKVSSAYMKPVQTENIETDSLVYSVSTPVSVKRGQSAMVPIIDQEMNYEQVCVYNGDKMPNHPLLVWWLKNESAITLEQGPTSIVQEGQYLGDGIIRFAGSGDDIQIAYALEFGILVNEEVERDPSKVLSIEIDRKKRVAIVNHYHIVKTIYSLSSHINQEQAVYIERRDPEKGEYFKMPDPTMTMGEHTRWPVIVPAHGQASFAVKIRYVRKREDNVSTWERDFIMRLDASNMLPKSTISQLIRLQDEDEAEKETQKQISLLNSEYAKAVSRQDQLRQNINVLGESKRESVIRNRVLDDLETSENRRRELESQIEQLEIKLNDHQASREQLLDDLFMEDAHENE
ncbi:MAG: hypothetical protein GY943_34160 [Chloroflexi bacterium]|nr:hypothetical protein [Chloroflexota bacterium]